MPPFFMHLWAVAEFFVRKRSDKNHVPDDPRILRRMR